MIDVEKKNKTHIVMKSQVLQSVRPEELIVSVPVQNPAGLRTRVSGQVQGQKTDVPAQVNQSGGVPSYSERVSLFVLVRLSSDQGRAPHTRECICFTQSTDSDVNLNQNHAGRQHSE